MSPRISVFPSRDFVRGGGKTDEHRDGWGIAFFEGLGCRTFIDVQPSIASPIAELIKNYPIHSTNVIAHIRKATQGEIKLENCHPFRRELWGKYWVFAHNGNLENFSPAAGDFYQPVGDTDSEKAFCLILNTLRETFPQGKPSLEQLYQVLKTITTSIACQGIFNYLLSDGEHFFAHCSTKLSYIIRQYPFAAAHLIDEDVSVDFQALARPGDQVAIIATTPLTDNEVWTAINSGELLVFQEGAAILS